MLKKPTSHRTEGYHPRAGWAIARTWAVAHGSAWLAAADLIEWPGIFAGEHSRMIGITRALDRCNIPYEKMYQHSQFCLYRLAPETVEALLSGDL